MRERTFAPSQGPPSEAEFLVTIIAQSGGRGGGGFGENGFKKSNWNIANSLSLGPRSWESNTGEE